MDESGGYLVFTLRTGMVFVLRLESEMRAFKAFIAFAEHQSRVFGLNVRFPLMTLTAGDDRLAMTDDDSRSSNITAITMFGLVSWFK